MFKEFLKVYREVSSSFSKTLSDLPVDTCVVSTLTESTLAESTLTVSFADTGNTSAFLHAATKNKAVKLTNVNTFFIVLIILIS